MRRVILSQDAAAPVGPYPHAVRVGNWLFLSGIGPRQRGSAEIPGVIRDADGRVVEYDFEAQCHAVFRNIGHILRAAGARWEDIVDVTAFLVDIERDFAAFNRVYARYLGHVQACRTTVEVRRLPTPIAIELKCIAYVEDR
ncbi:MAG: Rid family hydrolase [Candidatus Kapabacteria bacterium]|nr:Rid family hydrolase [Candidatus Kapabacteria bacterium]MCS7170057.1 Rid family hydrolase [Candidatus Kapabacteria bacterium]MDW7997077.1 Rid family hydrolase [Bacteroidota bacterium]MDW8225538.1 Rid family hydrolase [Bacteroidota bacterium]